jgi:hypothetical protein
MGVGGVSSRASQSKGDVPGLFGSSSLVLDPCSQVLLMYLISIRKHKYYSC